MRALKSRHFPMDIFTLENLKSALTIALRTINLPKRFKPRLYSYVDYFLPKIYTMICPISLEVATEDLNTRFTAVLEKKHKLKMKLYADGKRHRRLIPHQTDVDKFFRLFTAEEVRQVFGQVLIGMSSKIKRKLFGDTTLRMLVDNTKYPYYGRDRTHYEIGHNKLPGTKVCRMFQGYMIHSCGVSLFTEFRALRLKHYRAIALRPVSLWLKWNNLAPNYACMDREFYRVNAIRDLRKAHVPVILPAIKSGGVRQVIRDYLLKKQPIAVPYLFTQSASHYPFQSSVQLTLVVVGHEDQSAQSIRERYWSKKVSYDEAISQLAAFFTTLKPWKNLNAWASWLTRTYKSRWNEETGFCKLNEVHESFRHRDPIVHLSELYLRAIIYNDWQYYKKRCERDNLKKAYSSLKYYKVLAKKHYEKEIYRFMIQRINKRLKTKREVYFQ